ncbi:MAG TPA: hypothetical protein VJP77_03415 [Planctomycetota bacterium]|nr:hypothetical protein [Planctomycetota bacterium]
MHAHPHRTAAVPNAVALAVPLALAALSSLAAPAAAQSGGFQAGDLYLYNPAYQGLSSSDGALVRIDPLTGAQQIVVDLVTSNSSGDVLAYDPFRDRLIFFGGLVPNSNSVYLCDAAGNLQPLGFTVTSGPTLGRFAPRGDGLIYFVGHNAPGTFQYLDAANQAHPLLDAAGVAPYVVGGLPGPTTRLHYHPPTNSLVATTTNNSVICPGGENDAVNIHQLQLSPDGTRVLSETCFQYDLHPTNLGEVPVGLSNGPGGDLLLVVDDNTNTTLPRMARIDPVAGTATPFAWNGGAGSAATNAGCYSHVRGQAVILDTGNDVLRAFSAGESGQGTIIATGVSSAGGSGETATLIEIGTATPLYGLSASPGSISLSAGGTQTLSLDLGPAHAGAPYFVLGSTSGFAPGVLVDGQLLPLVIDAYTLLTLQKPNQPPLTATFGLLDGTGHATASVTLPPGSPPALAGAVAHHAALVFGGLVVVRTTNAVPLELVP